MYGSSTCTLRACIPVVHLAATHTIVNQVNVLLFCGLSDTVLSCERMELLFLLLVLLYESREHAFNLLGWGGQKRAESTKRFKLPHRDSFVTKVRRP